MAELPENAPISSENLPEAPITEDAIKRMVVPFLRQFYKNRYAISYGTERTEFDLENAAGHRVDSRLTFNKEDGSPFSCAVEATSMDNLEEVKFSLNTPYFIWACVASASFSLGILYLIFMAFPGRMGLWPRLAGQPRPGLGRGWYPVHDLLFFTKKQGQIPLYLCC